jgi:hypothetical protein
MYACVRKPGRKRPIGISRSRWEVSIKTDPNEIR